MPDAAAHALPYSHQFDSVEQQRASATLGMWLFLVNEIMFFGGLFLAYTLYRWRYPAAFAAASNELDLTLGAINTVVLIGSSLTMALAVRAAQTGARRAQVAFLVLTMALGAAFLGIKAVEYGHKFEHHLFPGPSFHFDGPDAAHAAMFFVLYFCMTGLHAAHMVAGIAVLAVLAVLASRGRFGPLYHNPMECAGLYWHLVDIVWIFLFPLLYLQGHRP